MDSLGIGDRPFRAEPSAATQSGAVFEAIALAVECQEASGHGVARLAIGRQFFGAHCSASLRRATWTNAQPEARAPRAVTASVRVSSAPVEGRFDGGVEVGPPDDTVPTVEVSVGKLDDACSQPFEVSPSLFVDDVRHGSELGVELGTEVGEDGATVVAGEDVVGVEVDVGADVDGAVVVDVEVGADDVVSGLVVVVTGMVVVGATVVVGAAVVVVAGCVVVVAGTVVVVVGRRHLSEVRVRLNWV